VTYSFALLFRYRMDWSPHGYGLGELLTSLSLLPNEELVLEFKTWETSKTQQDQKSEVDEKNTSDIQKTQSDVREVMDDFQSSESFDLKTHAEATWGWGSASVDANYSTSSKEHHRTTSKRARAGTQKSSNALAQKRSMKVAISRETGSESKTTRKIKNSNQCRTLNVNYFQLLKQYKISMYLYDVELILLGNTHQTSGSSVQLGTIFATTLPEPASVNEHVESLLDYSLDSNPLDFQAKILEHCTPRPDIDITDEYGNRRYAFAINPGPWEDRDNDNIKEHPAGLEELLEYLYGFYTAQSPPPDMADVDLVVEDGSAYDLSRIETAITVPRHHFLQGLEISEFTDKVSEVRKNIIDEYLEARAGLDPEEMLDDWFVQLPTNGIYAETMLGACSGCEDYYEIDRQYDLELKELEIRKLEAEVEKLKLENQAAAQGEVPKILIKNPTDETDVNLQISLSDGPVEVAVESES
jgi:hypothetical protein